jgi:hypothetical protein
LKDFVKLCSIGPEALQSKFVKPVEAIPLPLVDDFQILLSLLKKAPMISFYL